MKKKIIAVRNEVDARALPIGFYENASSNALASSFAVDLDGAIWNEPCDHLFPGVFLYSGENAPAGLDRYDDTPGEFEGVFAPEFDLAKSNGGLYTVNVSESEAPDYHEEWKDGFQVFALSFEHAKAEAFNVVFRTFDHHPTHYDIVVGKDRPLEDGWYSVWADRGTLFAAKEHGEGCTISWVWGEEHIPESLLWVINNPHAAISQACNERDRKPRHA